MHPTRTLAALTLFWLAVLLAPLNAQIQRTDLSDLFLRNALPPLMAAAPAPEGSAFLTVNGPAFDRIDPLSITDARIDRFPLGADRSATLLLRRFDVMAPTGVTVIGTSGGERPFTPDKHLIFSGTVEGIAGSYVYLAVFHGFSAGYIDIPASDGTSTRYMISPDNIGGMLPATMIVSDARTLPPSGHGAIDCGAENLPGYQERVDKVFKDINDRFNLKIDGRDREQLASKTLAVQIAVDCDIRYLQGRNYNLSQAVNYALIVFGTSSAIYQRDANVALQIPYLRVWTEMGPYPGPTINDLLGQVRDYWSANMGDVQRSTTVLLSKDIGGGLAWVNVLCHDYGYAAVGLDNGVNFPGTNYLWDVDVTSHELGHNFGSPHTHNCSWAPPIDSCYASEGGCSSEITPRPGSIMSYCHLTASGTQLYLHPRVATLIRRNFELSSCINPVDGALDNDIAVVQIVAPVPGGTLIAGNAVMPSAIIRNIGTRTQTNIQVALAVTATTTQATFYNATRTIASLAPGASATVAFDQLTLTAAQHYLVKASAEITGDERSINNTLVRPFQVSEETPTAAITLTSPNGGGIYPAGSTVQVQWSATGTTDVTIQFSTDDGITWMPIRYKQSAASGTLNWTVPAIPTTRARVRINSLSEASSSDMSDTTFTITVGKDLQAFDFIDPVAAGSAESPLSPKVEFRNNGTETLRNVPVRLRMTWRPNGAEVYNATETIAEIAPGAVTTVDFPATPVLPDGEHVMIARALLDGDEAPSNDSIGRTSSFAGLAPPIAVKAYPMSRAVLLSWTPSVSKSATGYEIYRGTSPENLTLRATLRSTVLAYADEPLEDNTTYFYAVRSVTDAKRSLASRPVSAMPMTFRAGFALAAPELLLPGADVDALPVPVNMVWRSMSGGEIYQMQVAADEAMTDVVFNQFTETPGTQFQPDFGATYYWRVRAFNYSTTGPWSSVHRFSTQSNCAGGALAFDGATTRMEAPGFSWSGKEVTVEYWNYVSSADVTNGSAFNVGTDGGVDRFQAHSPWGDRMLVWDYGDFTTNGRIATDYSAYLDKWTHVALVSDGEHFKGIYLNGVLVNSSPEASYPPARTRLVIGAFFNDYHKGLIDEFRIWNRVRSEEEIGRDMSSRITAPQPGLVGYWRFDEGTGTTVADLSGSGAAGTLTADTLWRTSTALINCEPSRVLSTPQPVAPADGATLARTYAPNLSWGRVEGAGAYHLQVSTMSDFWDPEWDIPNVTATSHPLVGLRPATTYFWRVRPRSDGQTGPWSAVRRFTTAEACMDNALYFDGTKAAVAIDSFAFDGRAVTIEFWNYIDSATLKNGSAFALGAADNVSNRMQAHVPWSDKRVYWDYGNINTTGRLSAPYDLYMNKWTHVALVSNGIDAKQIYLDGYLVANSGSAGFPHDLSKLTIGGMPGASYHLGTIDEFRIWNTPRTQAQIHADMYRKLPPPQSGLIGYWNMDEGMGIATRDSSGFDHNGVLVNGPEWRSALLPLTGIAAMLSGPAIVTRGSAGNVYSVPNTPGMSYRWIVIGGTITDGDGTNSLTVRWGDGGEGLVRVNISPLDGLCDFTAEMGVEIMAPAGVETGQAITDLAFTNAPNPFSATTTISYRLTRRQNVSLAVYSLDGALVARLADGPQDPGDHQAVFNGEGLPSGIYICRVGVGDRYLYVKALHLVR